MMNLIAKSKKAPQAEQVPEDAAVSPAFAEAARHFNEVEAKIAKIEEAIRTTESELQNAESRRAALLQQLSDVPDDGAGRRDLQTTLRDDVEVLTHRFASLKAKLEATEKDLLAAAAALQETYFEFQRNVMALEYDRYENAAMAFIREARRLTALGEALGVRVHGVEDLELSDPRNISKNIATVREVGYANGSGYFKQIPLDDEGRAAVDALLPKRQLVDKAARKTRRIQELAAAQPVRVQ